MKAVLSLLVFLLPLAVTWSVGVTPENTNYISGTSQISSSWSFESPRSVWSSPALIVDEHVFWHTNVGLHKLSLATGEPVTDEIIRVKSKSSTVMINPSADMMAMYQFPNMAQTDLHFISTDLSTHFTYPATTPYDPVADATGVVFCDQRIVTRVSWDGNLLQRRSVDDSINLVPSFSGYYGFSFNNIYHLNPNLSVKWKKWYPGVRHLSADHMNGMIFFGSSSWQERDFQFFVGVFTSSGHPVEIFKRNVTRVHMNEGTLFSTVVSDSSVVFGVGERNGPLRLVHIPKTNEGYGDAKVIIDLSESAEYQGHTVFPSNVIAVSFYDMSLDVYATRVVFIDLTTFEQIGELQRENSKGLSIVGFGDLCVLWISKGSHNVPNRLSADCL
ncbi:hypothetical protein P9112_013753 [Eukaryota sp. TZLM1-RC]